MAAELLRVDHLTVKFGGLTAVNDVGFFDFPRRDRQPDRAERGGEDHDLQRRHRLSEPGRGIDSIRGRGADPSETAPDRGERGLPAPFRSPPFSPVCRVQENIRTGHHIQERETLWDAFLNTRRKRRVEEETLAKTAEILKFIGLEEKKETIAGSLPYGDQRILEIGIALAANPKLLLLDEPSAGLNDTETRSMKDLIQKMREKSITIFLVEHDMKLVMGISDRIVVLNFGKKIATGTPEEIKNNPEVIRAYFGERKRDVKR